MKNIEKHHEHCLNDNKQTVNYPTDMEPQEAYFFGLLGVIVATMPHGIGSHAVSYIALYCFHIRNSSRVRCFIMVSRKTGGYLR